MTWRILVTICWLARFAPAQTPACYPVEGNRIDGKHLAEALPAFRKLPPDVFLATAAPAGSSRTLRAAELKALAERYAIPLTSAEDVCFEIPMEPLNLETAAKVMREALPNSASVEITEAIMSKVPRGNMEFPIGELGRPALRNSKEPTLWRGQIVYGNGQRFPIWARVRVSVPCRQAVATQAIRAGQQIEQEQFQMVDTKCFPDPQGASISAAPPPLGMAALRSINSGAEILPEFVAPPNDINPGDVVQVEVLSGGAKLSFTAKAETGGRRGDYITLRNPSSNRTFRARVQAKGEALLVAGVTNESGSQGN